MWPESHKNGICISKKVVHVPLRSLYPHLVPSTVHWDAHKDLGTSYFLQSSLLYSSLCLIKPPTLFCNLTGPGVFVFVFVESMNSVLASHKVPKTLGEPLRLLTAWLPTEAVTRSLTSDMPHSQSGWHIHYSTVFSLQLQISLYSSFNSTLKSYKPCGQVCHSDGLILGASFPDQPLFLLLWQKPERTI